ncbi:MAG: hypothetical protein ABJJ25_15395 [Eudoraea sp.]|uniref:hypothetical protein n=1 Tax=Eudoraea sp. TaxID=1979955 RepID=UPI003265970B
MDKNKIAGVLLVLFIIIMSAALISTWNQRKRLQLKTEKLEVSLAEVSAAKDQIEEQKTIFENFYNDCKNDNNEADLWKIANATNTLFAYSNYAQISNPEGAKLKELNNAVDNLLSKKGYVQYIETNGNKLFAQVNLSLEGEFVRFITDKAVRDGAIGIKNCGSPNQKKTGDIILKGKTVKIIKLCEATSSKNVWAYIAF